MSLHDIDKKNHLRGISSLNENDSQQQRMAHNTMGTTYRSDSDTNQQRIIFKNGLILTYDNDDKISSVYGYIPSVSAVPVLIIAKDGYDVFEDILEIDRPEV